jgi:hypothetical protein
VAGGTAARTGSRQDAGHTAGTGEQQQGLSREGLVRCHLVTRVGLSAFLQMALCVLLRNLRWLE